MVFKGVNSIGLQVMRFDPIWSALIFYVWSLKESIQLVYKWSRLICLDLVWSALKFYVWSWKESIELVYNWSGLIWFELVWSALTFYVWSWKGSTQLSTSGSVWSALTFYIWFRKESIQLVCKWSGLIRFALYTYIYIRIMLKCIFTNIHVKEVIGHDSDKHKSFIFNSTFGVIHCNVHSQSCELLPCIADEY